MPPSTVCLTMIVKNETKVITRCFDSCYKYLDYWVIHDTGSIDGTPELIQQYFKEKNISGELHHTPWKNFEYNRTKAVRSAKGKADYLLLLDADFIVNVHDERFKEKLGADQYLIKYDGGLDYRQALFVSGKYNWRYYGVTHEYISCPQVKTNSNNNLNGFTIHHHADGGCRKDKILRDIQLLKNGLKEELDNGRYWFYLAQSYFDHHKHNKASICYLKRSQFKNVWAEELYMSQFKIGMGKMYDQEQFWDFMPDLLKAYTTRPGRIESLYNLVRFCRMNNMHQLGYTFGSLALQSYKYPENDALFIDKSKHDWEFLDEVALCAYYDGKPEISLVLNDRILKEGKYSKHNDYYHNRLMQNNDFYIKSRDILQSKAAIANSQSQSYTFPPLPPATVQPWNKKVNPAIINDPVLLRKELRKDPQNSVNWFYLGLKYSEKRNFDDAIICFKRCIKLHKEKPSEEVYNSWYRIGLCKITRGDEIWSYLPDLLRAYMGRQHRLEALHTLVRQCRLGNMRKLGYALAKLALPPTDANTITINPNWTKDTFFVNKSIHEWEFLDEMALLAHYAEDHHLAIKLGGQVLAEDKYNKQNNNQSRLSTNIDFYKAGLKKQEELKQMQEYNDQINKYTLKQIEPPAPVPAPVPIVETKSAPVPIEETKSALPTVSTPASPTVSTPAPPTPTEEPAAVGVNVKLNFVRIKPEMKEKRIAMFIVNYNMVERTDMIVEYMKSTCQWPLDIFVVDNGSNKMKISQYTSLYLGENVQTTHGWLMGLHYADSLEITQDFKYLGYMFVITSTEMVPNQGDVISKMSNVLVDDPLVVGVHPALSKDSTTHWKHLLHSPKSNGGMRLTNMIDNIFSLYRADWFNKIGRFNETLTYAWGIDIETCYFARCDGKKLIIDDSIQVKKITNIGYKMGRMSESSASRHNNAQKQMTSYLRKKYGANHNDIIMKKNSVVEGTKYEKKTLKNDNSNSSSTSAPKTFSPNITPQVPTTLQVPSTPHIPTTPQVPSTPHILTTPQVPSNVSKLKLEKNESGHRLLLEHIDQNKNDFAADSLIVEIGATREQLNHLDSTFKLAKMAEENDYKMITIDFDQESINNVKKRITYDKFACIVGKAEDVIITLPNKIDMVYLDGFDYSTSIYHHSAARREKYMKYAGLELNNENCYKMHLECVQQLHPKLAINSLICINSVMMDNDEYKNKGRLAVPYLLNTGCYTILKQAHSAILLRKIAMPSNANPTTQPNSTPNSTIPNSIVQSNPSNNDMFNATYKKLGLKEGEKYIVTLMGYTSQASLTIRPTNWYPWNRFLDVFKTEGYKCEWIETNNIKRADERRIWICWNEPTSIELIKAGHVRKDDIILQKLTSLGKGYNSEKWGDNPKEWCKTWNWPLYQTVEYLYDLGFNIYGFGCQTHWDEFPEKKRIVDKLTTAGRIFWINWGSTAFNKQEIMNCKPIMDGFTQELGFVGSIWGQPGRGNVDQMAKFMTPLIQKLGQDHISVSGIGSKSGQVSDEKMKQILRSSKICPILHAPSWVAEKGIQDRFYTVFTSGRFGVCDNEGVYDFFDKDEVVVETNPEKYIEKTLYFIEHPEEQLPYIEKVQKKIREKYNLYLQWDQILTAIINNNDNDNSSTTTNTNASRNYENMVTTVKKDVKEALYSKLLT